MVRHLFHTVVGHIGHQDTPLRGRLNIYTVIPNLSIADQSTPVQILDDNPWHGSDAGHGDYSISVPGNGDKFVLGGARLAHKLSPQFTELLRIFLRFSAHFERQNHLEAHETSLTHYVN